MKTYNVYNNIQEFMYANDVQSIQLEKSEIDNEYRICFSYNSKSDKKYIGIAGKNDIVDPLNIFKKLGDCLSDIYIDNLDELIKESKDEDLIKVPLTSLNGSFIILFKSDKDSTILDIDSIVSLYSNKDNIIEKLKYESTVHNILTLVYRELLKREYKK